MNDLLTQDGRLQALKNYISALGLDLAIKPPPNVAAGPFTIPADYVVAGAPNAINLQTATNIGADPTIRRVFFGGNAPAAGALTDIALFITGLEWRRYDKLGALTDTQVAGFSQQTMFTYTDQRERLIDRGMGHAVGDAYAGGFGSGVAAPGLTSAVVPSRVFEFPDGPVVVDLRSQSALLTWQAAIAGVAADVQGTLVIYGCAWRASLFDAILEGADPGDGKLYADFARDFRASRRRVRLDGRGA